MMRRRTARGVSFLELLVTIVIAVILTAMAVFVLGPRLQNQRLQSVTDAIELGLQKTQLQAMRQARAWTFALDPANNRYTMFAGLPAALPVNAEWVVLPATAQQVQVVAAGSTFALDNNRYVVTFTDQGFVSALGRLQLLNQGNNQLQTQVQINQLIGVVEKRCIYEGNIQGPERCV